MLGKLAQPHILRGAAMIVKLVRPNDVGAPCLLFGQDGLAGVLKTTPEVLAQLKGRSGFFEAELGERGWRLERPAPEQSW